MQVIKIYQHYTMSLFGITEELREAFSNSDGTVDDVGTEIFPDSIRVTVGMTSLPIFFGGHLITIYPSFVILSSRQLALSVRM